MKRILFALAMIASPVFAMGIKPPAPAATPVSAAAWTAFDTENARIQTLMQKHVSPPGTPVSQASRDMMAAFIDARQSKDANNLAAFSNAKANWLTAATSVCRDTPLPCGTVNPEPAPSR